MADDKNQGGFDRDRVRRQLGDAWQTARVQFDGLKDAMVRASHTAKVKLDAAFLRRERDRLYQHLGEETYRLIESGLLKVPELRDTVSRIDAIIEQIAQEESERGAWDVGAGPEDLADEDIEEEEEAWEQKLEPEPEPEPEPTPARKRPAAGTKKKTTRKKASKKAVKDPED